MCFFDVSRQFFFANQCGRAKKKHKVPEKTQNFTSQYAIQTLLALGAYSFERTHISFTVLDTPPNNNYCLVSNVGIPLFTLSGVKCDTCLFHRFSSISVFESIIMLSRLPLLLAAGPLHASLALTRTRAADRMHGLVSLKHGSCYCQRTLVATHIANLWVSAPGRVERWLDNSGAFSISRTTTLLYSSCSGGKSGALHTYMYMLSSSACCSASNWPGASICAANISRNIQHSLPNRQHLLFLKASSCCLQLITQVVVQAPISANRCIANYSFLFREAACRRLLFAPSASNANAFLLGC